MKDESRGLKSPLIQIPVEGNENRSIKAVLYPLAYTDTSGNVYPVFRLIKDTAIWTHIHPCLDKLLASPQGKILTVFNHEVINGLFNGADIIYFVKANPNGYWSLMNEEKFLEQNLSLLGTWDFDMNNQFNKVFLKIMEETKMEQTPDQPLEPGAISYIEGFIRPSIVYQFKNGFRFDLFEVETIARLRSVGGTKFINTLFEHMNYFLNRLESTTELTQPFRDFIDVTLIGEGNEAIKSSVMDNGTYLSIDVPRTNISYTKLKTKCYRVAVRQTAPNSKYEYRLFELISDRNLDAFFNLYNFLAERRDAK